MLVVGERAFMLTIRAHAPDRLADQRAIARHQDSWPLVEGMVVLRFKYRRRATPPARTQHNGLDGLAPIDADADACVGHAIALSCAMSEFIQSLEFSATIVIAILLVQLLIALSKTAAWHRIMRPVKWLTCGVLKQITVALSTIPVARR